MFDRGDFSIAGLNCYRRELSGLRLSTVKIKADAKQSKSTELSRQGLCILDSERPEPRYDTNTHELKSRDIRGSASCCARVFSWLILFSVEHEETLL
jgi:hypothetical protein